MKVKFQILYDYDPNTRFRGADQGAGPAPDGFQGDDVVDGDYKEV